MSKSGQFIYGFLLGGLLTGLIFVGSSILNRSKNRGFSAPAEAYLGYECLFNGDFQLFRRKNNLNGSTSYLLKNGHKFVWAQNFAADDQDVVSLFNDGKLVAETSAQGAEFHSILVAGVEKSLWIDSDRDGWWDTLVLFGEDKKSKTYRYHGSPLTGKWVEWGT